MYIVSMRTCKPWYHPKIKSQANDLLNQPKRIPLLVFVFGPHILRNVLQQCLGWWALSSIFGNFMVCFLFQFVRTCHKGQSHLMIVIIAPDDRKVFGSKIFTTQTWVLHSPAKMKNDYILSECLLEFSILNKWFQKNRVCLVGSWLMTYFHAGVVGMSICFFVHSLNPKIKDGYLKKF